MPTGRGIPGQMSLSKAGGALSVAQARDAWKFESIRDMTRQISPSSSRVISASDFGLWTC